MSPHYNLAVVGGCLIMIFPQELLCPGLSARGISPPDLQLHAWHDPEAEPDHHGPGHPVEHLKRQPGGGHQEQTHQPEHHQGSQTVRGDVHVHLGPEEDPQWDGGQHQGLSPGGDGGHQQAEQVAHSDVGLSHDLRPRHRLSFQQGQLLNEVHILFIIWKGTFKIQIDNGDILF